MNCVYCDDADIRARTIVKSEYSRAFPTNIPITPGHALVIPERHVATLSELNEVEVQDLLSLVVKVERALAKVFGAEGFNVAFNEGEVAGQTVPHFHVHVVPRVSGDTGIYHYEPRQFLYRPGSRSQTPEEELREISSLLRSVLQ